MRRLVLLLALLGVGREAAAQACYSTQGSQEYCNALTPAVRFGFPRYATAALPTCNANNKGAVAFDTTATSYKGCDGSSWAAIGGSGGTPAGNDGEIQYNSGGAFGADANLYWDSAAQTMFIVGTFEVTELLGSELAPSLATGTNWTSGTGWAAGDPAGNKNAAGTGTLAPTTPLSIVAGTTYKVVITLSACSVCSTAAYGTVTLGGVTPATYQNQLNTATTYTYYIRALTTGSLIITAVGTTSRFTISAISVKAAEPNFSTDNYRITGNQNVCITPSQECRVTSTNTGSAGLVFESFTGATSGTDMSFRFRTPTNVASADRVICIDDNDTDTCGLAYIDGSGNVNFNGTIDGAAITSTSNILAGGASVLGFSGRSELTSPANGEVNVENSANSANSGVRFSRIVEVVTTTKSPSATENGEIYTNTGDADGSTITLLNDPTIGSQICVAVDPAQTVTVAPSAGESILQAGTAYTTSCTNNVRGSTACFIAITGGSGALWSFLSAVGTWTCS